MLKHLDSQVQHMVFCCRNSRVLRPRKVSRKKSFANSRPKFLMLLRFFHFMWCKSQEDSRSSSFAEWPIGKAGCFSKRNS